MPKVRFEIYSTERGKKLIDLGELLVESGYLQSFDLDEEGTEVIFNFEVNAGFDVEKGEIKWKSCALTLTLPMILVRSLQMSC